MLPRFLRGSPALRLVRRAPTSRPRRRVLTSSTSSATSSSSTASATSSVLFASPCLLASAALGGSVALSLSRDAFWAPFTGGGGGEGGAASQEDRDLAQLEALHGAHLGELSFTHPYLSKSWLWQLLFRTWRFAYLCAVFLPCALTGAASAILGTDAMRARSIRILLRSFERAGCTFQKFAQWLSMRPDMVPADLAKALTSLQQSAPTHSFEDTRRGTWTRRRGKRGAYTRCIVYVLCMCVSCVYFVFEYDVWYFNLTRVFVSRC